MNFIFLHYGGRKFLQLNSLCESLMLSPKGSVMSRLNVIHHDQYRSEFLLVGDPEHEFRDMK